MFDWLFGCSHVWFNFRGISTEITVTNGIDLTFTFTPRICIKCKDVSLKYIKGNI